MLSFHCKKIESLLFCEEEELSFEQSETLNKHLKRCPSCAEERELFVSSVQMLETLEEPSCTGVRAGVWSTLEDEKKMAELSPPSPFCAQNLAMLTLLGFGIGFVIGLGNLSSDRTPQRTNVAGSSIFDNSLVTTASVRGEKLRLQRNKKSQTSPRERSQHKN